MANKTLDLERFVSAQATTFDAALRELRQADKRGHWMWFIFPQLRGLGLSQTAMFYGIGSLPEAQAYLAHEILGPRLVLCTRTVYAAPDGRTLNEIFGSPDDMKFRSSMTLFARVAGAGATEFRDALDRFCGGRDDPKTLELLTP